MKIFVSIFLFVIILISCKNNDKEKIKNNNTKIDYGIIKLNKEEAILKPSFPITIKGQEDVEIRARVEGFIENTHVDEGSIVKAGQILFKVSCPQAEQEFRNSKAAISRAKAKIKNAKINVTRLKELADNKIISTIQLQTAENDYETSLAELESAEAAYENASAKLGWTNVTSPIDGVVGSLYYRKGSLVNSSNILTTVSNIRKVYAYFSLNETKLVDFLSKFKGKTVSEKINNSPELTLLLSNGSTYPYKGKIETITGHIDTYTGSASIRAEFLNPEGFLRSGTSGRIVIPQKIDDVFIIPQRSTIQQQNKTMVYKIDNDTVRLVVVSIIPISDGQNFAVTHGLKEGDYIATKGILGLKDGIIIKQN